jgi:hypothetical protein
MADQKVQHDFVVKDSGTATLNRIASAATRASSSLHQMNAPVTRASGALGMLRGAGTSAANVLGSITSSALSVAGGGLAVLGAGVIAATTSMATMQSSAEGTRLRLSGMLVAFGQAGNMAQGAQIAAQTLEQINRAAATLPGEAEEYVTVFTAGFASINQAVGGSLTEMTNFSNRFAAIGRTMGVDAEQIGRDLQQVLGGHAGADVLTFQRMLPYLRLVRGQANLTAEAFNRMSSPERVRILNAGMASLGPMLEEAGGTFDAITGSIKSSLRSIAMTASAPMFERMKTSLQAVDRYLQNSSSSLRTFGDTASGYVDPVIAALTGGFQRVADVLDDIANSPALEGLMAVGRTAGGVMGRIYGGGAENDASDQRRGGAMAAGTALGAAALGPIGAVIGATAVAFMSHTDAVRMFVENTSAAFGSLTQFIEPLAGLFSSISNVLGNLAAGILPGVMAVFEGLMNVIGPVLTPVIQTVTGLFNAIAPGLRSVTEGIFGYISVLMEFMLPISRLLGTAFELLLRVAVEPLGRAFGLVLYGIGQFLRGIRLVIGRLASGLDGPLSQLDEMIRSNTGLAARGTPATTSAAVPGATALAAQTAAATAASVAARAASPAAPAARSRAGNYYDFRGSRFDITQEFAQGFDPDRIAVGFADDISQLGERRTQSAFSPLFAVR